MIMDSNWNINTINTFWTEKTLDVYRGLDFQREQNDSILVTYTHLNHDPFRYTITFNNMNNKEVEGTVRIFLAPKTDRFNRKLSFDKQKDLMIDLDKFSVTCKLLSNTIFF